MILPACEDLVITSLLPVVVDDNASMVSFGVLCFASRCQGSQSSRHLLGTRFTCEHDPKYTAKHRGCD